MPMKQKILIAVVFIFTIIARAQAQTPMLYDHIIGFATLNGGTTGGQEGATVTATTLEEFQTYVTSSTPYTILVPQEISGGPEGVRINLQSNKTILGVGTSGFLNGIGLNINNRKNIIIRNLKFSMSNVTLTYINSEGRPQVAANDGDCITVQGTSTNLWIDHCEFYNADPSVQTNQDLYDGFIDVKGKSQYITISWCYFHDHHKSTLVGSSDSDNADRLITFHHNYYENISERVPSYRYGHAHVFNSYFVDLKSSGINSRMGACIKIESNYFENCKDPVVAKNSPEKGYWDLSGNLYDGSSGSMPSVSNCSYTPPYDYSSVLQEVQAVKDTVLKYAGVGVTATTQQPLPSVAITSPTANTTFDATADVTLEVAVTAVEEAVGKVDYYQGLTFLGTSTTAPFTFMAQDLGPGTYQITAVALNQQGVAAISVPVTIVVKGVEPPSVTITYPLANAVYAPLADVMLEAEATDTEGAITKVDFYNGATLLGTDYTSPYSYNWNNVSEGVYTITAMATDDNGGVKTSEPISLTVSVNTSVTGPGEGQLPALFPNPTYEAFTLVSDEKIIRINVFTQEGKKVLTRENIPSGDHVALCSELEAGTYIMRVYYASGEVAVYRAVKVK